MQFQTALTRLECLRKLFVNENQLTFEGIPAGIGKLGELQSFLAAGNRLATIPEGISRCGKLKKLDLNSNCLLTLPESIHYITDQCEIDLERNPDLVMPPKPKDNKELAYYNIDFSLAHQYELAGEKPTEQMQKAPTK